MPTRPTPRTRATPAPGRRFGRATPTRSSAATRRSIRRKPVPQSKRNKALNGLAGLVPGSVLGRAAKPSPGGGGKGRAGKLALLAGVAGLAMKNRDKLPGPLGRRDTAEPLPAEPVATTPDPLAPSAAAPSPAPVAPPPAI
jgi:hypothetical protein